MATAKHTGKVQSLWIPGTLVFLFVMLFTHDYLVFRQNIILKVEVLDAPVDCWSERRSTRYDFLSPERRRDFAPTRAKIVHWCGGVISNAGFYRLPETHALNLFDTPRATLIETLKEGCYYDVTVIGKGGFQGHRHARVPVIQRISRINRVVECEEPDGA